MYVAITCFPRGSATSIVTLQPPLDTPLDKRNLASTTLEVHIRHKEGRALGNTKTVHKLPRSSRGPITIPSMPPTLAVYEPTNPPDLTFCI